MSRLDALIGVDSQPLRPIEFAAALAELHGMIGETVLVTLSVGELFCGVAFRSRLELVETMPPDDSAVVLRFEHGEAVPLDPNEADTYIGGSHAGGPRWLEFQLLGGVLVRAEADSAERPPCEA